MNRADGRAFLVWLVGGILYLDRWMTYEHRLVQAMMATLIRI